MPSPPLVASAPAVSPPAAASAALASRPTPATPASRPSLAVAVGGGDPSAPQRPAREPEAPAAEPIRRLLDQASAAVAHGRTGEARALISELLIRRPPAHIDAEAGMLLADAARNEGDRDEAIRRYREVVRRHGALSQAEIALFFIAQLESEMGRGEAARRSLGDYLARYPRGIFLAEARTRLSRLDAP